VKQELEMMMTDTTHPRTQPLHHLRRICWLLTIALLVAAPLLLTTASHPVYAATRYHICGVQDVIVRTEPGGSYVGLLKNGETFDQRRYSPSGQWAEGYAYGQVNAPGWVPTAYLC
jgi:hypothetical protein